MKPFYLLILVGVFFSCKNTQTQETEVKQEIKKLSKLETLYTLPKDSIYEFYDLSNDSIKEFPDLSEYTIEKLDLSNNLLDTIILRNFPNRLEELNLSKNAIKNEIVFKYPLKKLDLSYNQIEGFYSGSCHIDKLILSNNNLVNIDIPQKLRYLDISDNPKFSNRVPFFPKKIDTIVHHNIANNKKLIFYLYGIVID